MDQRIIHYLASSNKTKIIGILQNYCRTQNIVLEELDYSRPFQSQYFMIIEPVRIGPKDYALSQVWKPWLLEKSPDTRMIVASNARSAHKNALHLLHLPADFGAWLNQIPPVKEYPLQRGTDERQGVKSVIISDPWEWFLPMSGGSMKKQMEKFLEGHDRTNSFANQLGHLRKNLLDVHDIMEADLPDAEKKELLPETLRYRKNAKVEWEALFSRWNYYEAFFAWLPFRETAKEIEMAMDELKMISKDWLDPQKIPQVEHLNQLQQLIKKDLDSFIYMEDYW